MKLREQIVDQDGLSGADLSGDDDKTLALTQPISQVGDRLAMGATFIEEPVIGRELERPSPEFVEGCIHTLACLSVPRFFKLQRNGPRETGLHCTKACNPRYVLYSHYFLLLLSL